MGFWELLLIALIVLMVAGPQRLPVIMRTLGRWAGRGRDMARSLQAELERETRWEEMDEPLKPKKKTAPDSVANPLTGKQPRND
jgi:sec-independent protein translocase protein TatB